MSLKRDYLLEYLIDSFLEVAWLSGCGLGFTLSMLPPTGFVVRGPGFNSSSLPLDGI